MKKNFKDEILNKINKENIEPINASYFQNKKRLIWLWIWMIWFFAIIFSGFLYDDSYDMFRNWMFGRWNSYIWFLPNIFWIWLIILLAFLWIRGLKETPVWYRSSYQKDILLWLAVVLIWAFIFRWIWIWPVMHSYFADIPGVSNILYNESAWNDPTNWRLAWTILEYNEFSLKLKSLDDKIWTVNLTNAFISPMSDTDIWEKIRIIWVMTSDAVFSADRLMPWFGRWMMNWGWMMSGNGDWLRWWRWMMNWGWWGNGWWMMWR